MRRLLRGSLALRRVLGCRVTTELHREAINSVPPGTGAAVAIPSGASTTAIDLSAYAGRWLAIKSDVDCHVRFGGASVGAATSGDWPMGADVDYAWRIPTTGTRSYARALDAGSAGGTLFYRVVSEPV